MSYIFPTLARKEHHYVAKSNKKHQSSHHILINLISKTQESDANWKLHNIKDSSSE